MARPLQDDEKELFEAIREASNIALLQCQFEDVDVAAICAVTTEDEARVFPLALLLTDELKDRLSLDGARVGEWLPT